MTKATLLQKKVLLPVVGVILSGAALFGVSSIANAQTGNNFESGLVQKIAQTFNLDQSKVQSVVDQYHQQNMQQMQQNMDTRRKDKLDSLVKDGKLTSSQEQAILDELKKLQSEYNFNNLKSMTPQQRQDTLQKMKAEIDSWAKSEGINAKYLLPLGGMRFHMGMRWQKLTTTPTPTP
jgi:hypothetical protein